MKVDIRYRAPRPATPPQKVVIHEEDCPDGAGDWISRVAVSRTKRGAFTLRAERVTPGSNYGGERKGVIVWSAAGIKTPGQLCSALVECASALGTDLDWEEVVAQVAQLDWVTAAVLAALRQHALPSLPTAAELRLQRPLRPLGKVRLGVEWGYELHDVMTSFEQWVRILSGASHSVTTPYRYEGQRFTAKWCFDKHSFHELHVTYDDCGEGWMGDFRDIQVVNGPVIDGIDLAQLCLTASLG